MAEKLCKLRKHGGGNTCKSQTLTFTGDNTDHALTFSQLSEIKTLLAIANNSPFGGYGDGTAYGLNNNYKVTSVSGNVAYIHYRDASQVTVFASGS